MRWPVFGNDWSTTGLESEREGLSKCPWPRTMASCIRPMHLQIWCQYRCTELEIVCFGQRRCYSLESKPSTRISVGGERRKTSGKPSRREQFCGNALVARAHLVLHQKRKARGFPSVPKGGLRTSETHMIAEKVNMYLSGCVSVDEKFGAQQAEKEEKRKRNKDKKKKEENKEGIWMAYYGR